MAEPRPTVTALEGDRHRRRAQTTALVSRTTTGGGGAASGTTPRSSGTSPYRPGRYIAFVTRTPARMRPRFSRARAARCSGVPGSLGGTRNRRSRSPRSPAAWVALSAFDPMKGKGKARLGVGQAGLFGEGTWYCWGLVVVLLGISRRCCRPCRRPPCRCFRSRRCRPSRSGRCPRGAPRAPWCRARSRSRPRRTYLRPRRRRR